MNKRNADDLETLYELYRAPMLAAARRILRDGALSEDAVQDSFIKLGAAVHRIKKPFEDIRTRAYVVTVTKNAAIDIQRRRKAEAPLPIRDGGDKGFSPSPEETYILAETDRMLIREMAEENPQAAAMIWLKHVVGLTYREMAAVYGLSVGGMKKRLHGARKLMRASAKLKCRLPAILIILLLLLALMACARPLVRVILRVYEQYVHLRVTDIGRPDEAPSLAVGYVPEGLEAEEPEVSRFHVTHRYTGGGRSLEVSYQLGVHTLNAYFDAEDIEVTAVEVNGCEAQIIFKPSEQHTTVEILASQGLIAVRGNLDREEMLKVAQSVQII